MVAREDILAVLRTIMDPEMPVNLVDLGLIERVEVTSAACAGNSLTTTRVAIDALPTFVGCPALDMIRGEIQARVGALESVAEVDVRWLMDPPWSTDRITAAGREALRRHGVTAPARGGGPAGLLTQLTVAAQPSEHGAPSEVVRCPFCGAAETQMESRFGPTRCRMIYYCRACRNSFEHLKAV